MTMASIRSEDPISKKIVFSFLEFLQKVELEKSDDREGVEVVTECLQNIFSLDLNDVSQKQAFGCPTNNSFPFYFHPYNSVPTSSQPNADFNASPFNPIYPNTSSIKPANSSPGIEDSNGMVEPNFSFSNPNTAPSPTSNTKPNHSDKQFTETHSTSNSEVKESPFTNGSFHFPTSSTENGLVQTEARIPESEPENTFSQPTEKAFREIESIEDLSEELQIKFSEFLNGLIDAGYFGEFLQSSEEYSQRLQVAKNIFLNSVNQARILQQQSIESNQENQDQENQNQENEVQEKEVLENTVKENSKSENTVREDACAVNEKLTKQNVVMDNSNLKSQQSQKHVRSGGESGDFQEKKTEENEISNDDTMKAESLKSKGNKAMSEKKYTEAIQFYTQAISINSKNAIYYCNRAAAYQALGEFECSLQDCERAIDLNPKYSKAYSRLGQAYSSLNRYHDAISKGFTIALELDSNNQIAKEGLELAKRNINQRNQNSNSAYSFPTQIPEELAKMAMEKNILTPDGLSFVNNFLQSQNIQNFQNFGHPAGGEPFKTFSQNNQTQGSAQTNPFRNAPQFHPQVFMPSAPQSYGARLGCHPGCQQNHGHHGGHHGGHRGGHHPPPPPPELNQGGRFVPGQGYAVPNFEAVLPNLTNFTDYFQNKPGGSGFDPMQFVQNVMGGNVGGSIPPKNK